MIATGGFLSELDRAEVMGLAAEGRLDLDALRARIAGIEARLHHSVCDLLVSQGVRMIRGTGRLKGPHEVVAETADGVEEIEADAILLATGSRPRIPDWAELDGERVLTTRHAYPPSEIPGHLVVIGSGVTGVEFSHMFRSLGSEVTPHRLPPAGAAGQGPGGRRGARGRVPPPRRAAPQGRPGGRHRRRGHGADASAATTAAWPRAPTPCSPSARSPTATGSASTPPGSADAGGYVPVTHHLQSNVPHIYAAGDLSGKLPLSSVAAMQGRKIAEHVMGLHTRTHRHLDYDKAASAIFTEPEIADVGLAEAEAFAEGRKLRVTKVPFSANAKALIEGDSRGFVKIISDPATGVVLGGSIVGRGAAELISVLALAVTCNLKVTDIVDSLLVHPALSESLADAAE